MSHSSADLHAIERHFRDMTRTINLLRREVLDLRDEVEALKTQMAEQYDGRPAEPDRPADAGRPV